MTKYSSKKKQNLSPYLKTKNDQLQLSKTGLSSDELNQHFHDGGNFGLLCEHKFFFVDIDVSHGSNGLLNFGKWLTEHDMVPDDILSQTLRARTPTGGIHLVFKQDKQHHFKQDIGVIEGVDLKASPNNFIVVSPSRINGKPYEWVNVDDIDEIQVVPKQLIEAFEQMAKHKNNEKKNEKYRLAKLSSMLTEKNISIWATI